MKKVMSSVSVGLATKVSSICKISFIWGSHISYFSMSSIIAPVSGAFLGVSGSFLVLLTRCMIHVALFKTISLSFLVFCIPGYFASLYWATHSSLIRVIVPLVCIVLFIVHPIGSQAFMYSFYWLLPILFYMTMYKSLFLEAFGSTLIAHAVGSVIWLYTAPTTVEMWLGLIPVDLIERLLFAIGMVVMYKAIMWIKNDDKASCMYYGWKQAMGSKKWTNAFRRSS
jgi:hypothetical protein